MGSSDMQVKDVEAAAARAAFESSHIIEEAMAQAASVRRQAQSQARTEVRAQDVRLHVA